MKNAYRVFRYCTIYYIATNTCGRNPENGTLWPWLYMQGKVADASGIQFRMLNLSKGPAVRGPRAQMDREWYKKNMQKMLKAVDGLNVLDDTVVDLVVNSGPAGSPYQGRVGGVVLCSGEVIRCSCVVLTTGTFLRGIVHVGSKQFRAGRISRKTNNSVMNESDATAAGSADKLAMRFETLGFALGRLKTGTPPRLDGTS